MQMKISIRVAEQKDSESISDLSGQLGYASDTKKIQNRLSEVLKNSDNCVFVATNDEEVIGWVHAFYAMRIESDSFVEIGGLVVNVTYQKMGVGKALVEKIYGWAQSKDCFKLRVRCNEIRKESHIFYEKIGFELNKVQKVFNINLN